ncbi:amidase [Roseovarius spongiae]|uniref:Amidase n=1 Tax=Roseovarius spongiae TaxID=2320272 RepID=A0A3A8B8C8_9RHOB|nr:amidase [Roseovarius spongiae]RKF13584.1 amidase [Roseovarius spongiae]
MISAHTTLTDLARALRAGQISSVDIVTGCLGRIRAQDGVLGAFSEVYEEEALAAAEGMDKLRQAGISFGPLHGLPIALKDLIEWKGHGCEFGSLSMKGRKSEVTAPALQRLLGAGMIPLGRTEMVEFAFGGWGANEKRGTPRNPYDLNQARIAGGSSSGSGVAVASGMCPAAIGSDTGGSVRIPASLTGLVGLKVTYGRISLEGCLSLSRTLDSLGPMTLSVDDAALLYHAMREDARPDAPHAPLRHDQLTVEGRNVAVMAPRGFPISVSPDIEAAYQAAQDALGAAGVRLHETDLPFDFAELTELNGLLIAAEAYHVHREYIHDDGVPINDAVRERVLKGASVSASDYFSALETRQAHVARYRDYMRRFDAILTPAIPFTAPTLDEVDESAAPLAQFTRPANYLSTCALSIPTGVDGRNLPHGVQLMGTPYGEEMILALGRALEQRLAPMPRPDLSVLKTPERVHA